MSYFGLIDEPTHIATDHLVCPASLKVIPVMRSKQLILYWGIALIQVENREVKPQRLHYVNYSLKFNGHI